jgi:hypothetical protein
MRIVISFTLWSFLPSVKGPAPLGINHIGALNVPREQFCPWRGNIIPNGPTGSSNSSHLQQIAITSDLIKHVVYIPNAQVSLQLTSKLRPNLDTDMKFKPYGKSEKRI